MKAVGVRAAAAALCARRQYWLLGALAVATVAWRVLWAAPHRGSCHSRLAPEGAPPQSLDWSGAAAWTQREYVHMLADLACSPATAPAFEGAGGRGRRGGDGSYAVAQSHGVGTRKVRRERASEETERPTQRPSRPSR